MEGRAVPSCLAMSDIKLFARIIISHLLLGRDNTLDMETRRYYELSTGLLAMIGMIDTGGDW